MFSAPIERIKILFSYQLFSTTNDHITLSPNIKIHALYYNKLYIIYIMRLLYIANTSVPRSVKFWCKRIIKNDNDYDNKFLLFGISRPIARNNFLPLNLSIKFIKILFSFLEFLYAKILHFCRENPPFSVKTYPKTAARPIS